jgi:hypothetical protein
VNLSWRGDQDKIGARAKKITTRSPSCGRDQVQIKSRVELEIEIRIFVI